jgi:hypothetical protein
MKKILHWRTNKLRNDTAFTRNCGTKTKETPALVLAKNEEMNKNDNNLMQIPIGRKVLGVHFTGRSKCMLKICSGIQAGL